MSKTQHQQPEPKPKPKPKPLQLKRQRQQEAMLPPLREFPQSEQAQSQWKRTG